jgi:hypothetical protein
MENEQQMDQEFKTVPGVPGPEPELQEEDDDDVLFGDAPEFPTKNPRYN